MSAKSNLIFEESDLIDKAMEKSKMQPNTVEAEAGIEDEARVEIKEEVEIETEDDETGDKG